MGSAVAAARTPSPDAVTLEVVEANQQSRAREVDVDDVRMLLTELRLRRQLRGQD